MADSRNIRMKTQYRKWCKARGFEPDSRRTKRRFAKALGVSYYTVESWLRPEDNGSYRKVTRPMLKLAEALNA